MLVLLILALLISLIMIPVGLPGTWLMLLTAIGFVLFVPGVHFGWLVVAGIGAIAVIAEVLDFALAAKFTRKYGGSKRGAWGAIIGGLAGVIIGVPIPVIGPIIGGLIGSFAGALVFELSGGATGDGATRAATGAAIGRAVALAMKVGAGFVIAAWLVASTLLG